METRKTTNVLLLVIILLLSIQVFTTIELSSNVKKYEKDKLEPELPTQLMSDDSKEELYLFFKEHYNKKDYKPLYDWVDESVRMEYPYEKMVQTVDMLHEQVGPIQDGFYNYFESMPPVNGVKAFILYYTIKTKRGVATLKINIMQQGEESYRNLGFTLVSK